MAKDLNSTVFTCKDNREGAGDLTLRKRNLDKKLKEFLYSGQHFTGLAFPVGLPMSGIAAVEAGNNKYAMYLALMRAGRLLVCVGVGKYCFK